MAYDSLNENNTRTVLRGLVGLALASGLAIGVPVTIANHLSSQQETQRIASCTRLATPAKALACVETIVWGRLNNTVQVKP